MSALLKHLLDPAYLYALHTGPGAGWGAPHVAMLAALLLGAGYAAWRAVRPTGEATERGPWWAAGGALLVAAALLAVQRTAPGPLSARIWYLSALATGGALGSWAALRRRVTPWLARRATWVRLADGVSGRANPGDPPLSSRAWGALAVIHAAGIGTLLVSWQAGWWLPVLVVGCLTVAGWRRLELLTPMMLAYGAWALRALVGDALGVAVARYPAFPYPDPWSPWFDHRATLLAGVIPTLLLTVSYVARRRAWDPAALQRGLAYGAMGAGAAWLLAVVVAQHSFGATGSDAFCYLQMATDLAHGGSARHAFPLGALLWERGLPTWPAAPVGYHPPGPDGVAAAVWPIGWPFVLAGLVALGGEGLALWGAPLCALVAAWLTYRLAREVAPDASPVAGGLAAAILLTSREGVVRALVPMADAAAQALAVATMWALWRARSRDPRDPHALALSACAGGLYAAAYWVRHPLLPLGLAALPACLTTRWTRRLQARHLAIFGVAALLGALPDLAYHWRAFGAPWAAESQEWFLLSWRHVVPSAMAMLRDGGLRREEFGYLAPLVVAGLVWQWRRETRRPAAATLTLGFGGALLLNLAYGALRLRDLLSLFPWLALWAGWGAMALWRWAGAGRHGRRARRALVLLGVVMALSARAAPTLLLPWRGDAGDFGHVSAEQRAGFDALAAALPPEAVVATGLNAGAVTRYTGRETLRPAAWSDDEWATAAALLEARGRRLYLLVDGEEMEAVLARSRALFALAPVGEYAIPCMGRGGQRLPGRAALYTVKVERAVP